jgi:hypothetical protein
MKKLVLLFFLVSGFALSSQVQAQDYQSAIGLRLGSPLSASYKFFISEPGAIELYLGFANNFGSGSFSIGGMYQHHLPVNISGLEGLNWYFGGGANILFFNCTGCGTAFGINGVIGLDYTFEDTPINLSVDYMPNFLITGYGDGYTSYGALAVRYTLR